MPIFSVEAKDTSECKKTNHSCAVATGNTVTSHTPQTSESNAREHGDTRQHSQYMIKKSLRKFASTHSVSHRVWKRILERATNRVCYT